jgi:hypothetical protein
MAWTSAQRVNGMQLNYEPCMQGLVPLLLYRVTAHAFTDGIPYHEKP